MLSCSYIIPLYNAEKYITQAINSILKHNFLPQDEIIIVNDCSTDRSLDVVNNLRSHQQATTKDRIHIISHTKNKGSAAASRNTAISHSSKEVIFCLDADNILPGNEGLRIRQCLEENELDVCGPERIMFFKGNLHITHEWIFEKRLLSFKDILSCHFWPGPSGNYAFTRKYFDRIGPYPVHFGKAYDSWAYGFMQVAEGGKFGICGDSYYLHRWGLSDSAFVLGASDPSIVLYPLLLKYSNLLRPEILQEIATESFKKDWYNKIGSGFFYPEYSETIGRHHKLNLLVRLGWTVRVKLFATY